MRPLVQAAASLAVSLLFAGSALAQVRQDFMLANRTGAMIDEVYVSPAEAEDWEEDVLGDVSLPDGRDLVVNFAPQAPQCLYDIKVIYEDEDEAEFRGVNLCVASKVTLFYDRRAGRSRFVVE